MLINGIKSTNISVMDRGLAYGDGLFSTIKVEYGHLQLWSLHLQRLQLGAQKLFFPAIDWVLLSTEIEQYAASLKSQKCCVVKIILTRGSGGRGYSAKGCDTPSRIISSAVYPDFYEQWREQGIAIIQCDFQLSSNKQLAGLKTLNRLDQVLIKKELEDKNALDGLVCNNDGYIIESCSANVFIYIDNHWQTPILDHCGVAGVQRQHILNRAKIAGITIKQTAIHISQLKLAKAICLTNALIGIVPVTHYQHHRFSAQGVKLCRTLQQLIEKEDN